MPFDAILFDKDGTLVDFDLTWGPAARDVMKTLADGDDDAFSRLLTVSRFDIERMRMLPDSPLLAGASALYGPLWAVALGRTDVAQLSREMDDLFHAAGLAFLAPIGSPREVLGVLAQRGLKLGIVSNDAEASVRAQADRLGLSEHLDYIAGHDTGYGRKPGAGMITAFAARFDISPARLAVVGDTMHDVDAAHAAGAIAIGVLSGPMQDHDLAQYADHVIDTLSDLAPLLDTLRV